MGKRKGPKSRNNMMIINLICVSTIGYRTETETELICRCCHLTPLLLLGARF